MGVLYTHSFKMSGSSQTSQKKVLKKNNCKKRGSPQFVRLQVVAGGRLLVARRRPAVGGWSANVDQPLTAGR
jgi:hypothetical protein